MRILILLLSLPLLTFGQNPTVVKNLWVTDSIKVGNTISCDSIRVQNKWISENTEFGADSSVFKTTSAFKLDTASSINTGTLTPYKYNQFNAKLDASDTLNLSDRIDTKIALNDTTIKIPGIKQFKDSLSNIRTTVNSKQSSLGNINGIVKGNGSGTYSAAIAGTDYQAALTNPVTAANAASVAGHVVFINNTDNQVTTDAGITWDNANKKINLTKDDLRATSSTALLIQNTTAADGANATQNAPEIEQTGSYYASSTLYPIGAKLGLTGNNTSGTISKFYLKTPQTGSYAEAYNWSRGQFTIVFNNNATSTINVNGGYSVQNGSSAVFEAKAAPASGTVDVYPINLERTNPNSLLGFAIRSKHTQYNASSVQRNIVYFQQALGVNASENSAYTFFYSPDGGTTKNKIAGFASTYGSNANYFDIYGTNGQRFGGTGTGSDWVHSISSDGTDLLIKPRVDNKIKIQNATGVDKVIINTSTGVISKGSEIGDSALLTSKAIDNKISFATTGQLEDRGSWDASGNAFPTTGGSGVGGAVVVGDKWTISVQGVVSSDTLKVGDIIISKINTPGQTLSNWNHIPVNQPKTVTLVTAGSGVNPAAVKYTGATPTNNAFYGNVNNGIYSLGYKGNMIISGKIDLTGTGSDFTNQLTISNSNSASGSIVSTISSNAYGLDIENSSTGSSVFVRNNGGATGKPFSYYSGTTELFNIDKDGKITANGGVQSVGSAALGATNLNIFRNDAVGANTSVIAANAARGTSIHVLAGSQSATLTDDSTGVLISSFDKYKPLIINIDKSATSTVSNNFIEFKYKNSTTVARIDSLGYIHNNPPHFKGWFADSSITISLTQNTWYQITNQTYKTSWPLTMNTGFADSGDTIICGTGSNGHYVLNWEVNIQGVDSKVYQYRMQHKRGATTTTLWQYEAESAGKTTLRPIESTVALEAGDRVWVELRSTSAAPGNVTIKGGQWKSWIIHQ